MAVCQTFSIFEVGVSPPSGRHPLFQATIPFSLSLRVDSQPLGFVTFFPTMLSLYLSLVLAERVVGGALCCCAVLWRRFVLCTIGMEMIISSQSPFANTN